VEWTERTCQSAYLLLHRSQAPALQMPSENMTPSTPEFICEWMSSFLTGHQHIMGYSVPSEYVWLQRIEGKRSPYSITACRVPELIPVIGSQLQVMWVINLTAGCHHFLPGPQLPSQPLRGLLPISAAWWTEARRVWAVCVRLLPDSVASAIWTQALLCLSPTR